jgi:gamma-glutamyltranspeptidase
MVCISIFGKGQIIHVRRDAATGRRFLVGGSDPRGDGAALGYTKVAQHVHAP